MQSSINVIKSNNVNLDDNREIIVASLINNDLDIKFGNSNSSGNFSEMVGNLSISILNKAKNESSEILRKAKENAVKIEKDAYECGYTQGDKNGFEDGYNRGYSDALLKGEEEAQHLINNCLRILKSCENEYKEFLTNKEDEIINLALTMAKTMARKELENVENFKEVVLPIIKELKNNENIIIKCNGLYVNDLKEISNKWIEDLNHKGEIFVMEDPLLDVGEVWIEKADGKMQLNIDMIEEQIKTIISMRT